MVVPLAGRTSSASAGARIVPDPPRRRTKGRRRSVSRATRRRGPAGKPLEGTIAGRKRSKTCEAVLYKVCKRLQPRERSGRVGVRSRCGGRARQASISSKAAIGSVKRRTRLSAQIGTGSRRPCAGEPRLDRGRPDLPPPRTARLDDPSESTTLWFALGNPGRGRGRGRNGIQTYAYPRGSRLGLGGSAVADARGPVTVRVNPSARHR